MIRRPIARSLIFAVLTAGLLAAPAHATSTEVWVRDGKAFRAGDLEGVRITPDGSLAPGAPSKILARPEAQILWDLALRGDAVWVGAAEGSGLLQVRFDHSGARMKPGDEPDVFALVAETDGSLVVATGPEGGIYRITPSEGDAAPKPEELLRPEAVYVWDLALHPSGDLIVATGLPGRVLRLPKGGGEPEVIWKTDESHVRTLAVADDGTVYAGTSDSGLLVRIEDGGRGFVLFDSTRTETVAIEVAADGAVWAAFVGGTRPSRAERAKASQGNGGDDEPGSMTITVRADGGSDDDDGDQARQNAARRRPALPQGGGVVGRFAPDDVPELIWSDGSETPMALHETSAGEMLLGTANPARIWWLETAEDTGVWSELDDAKAITALDEAEGRVAVATSLPATVSLFDPEARPTDEASWISDVLDTKSHATFGRVHAIASAGDAGAISVFARVGNTSEPGEGWTEWREVEGAAAPPSETGGDLDLPPARFFQTKVSIAPPRAGDEPALVTRLEMRYRTANGAPRIDEIGIEPLGLAWRPIPPAIVAGGDRPVVEPARSDAIDEALSNGAKRAWRSKKIYEPGAVTVTWDAKDPNGDDLVARLSACRDEGRPCERWTVLADELERNFHSFDGRMLEDGVYRFRVEVDDHPSNPVGEERATSRISRPVVIDNSPPAIEALNVERGDGGDVALRVEASDDEGRIARAEVSVEPGAWRAVLPADGVVDGPREVFEVRLGRLEASDEMRWVDVRVADHAGNVVTRRVEIGAEP